LQWTNDWGACMNSVMRVTGMGFVCKLNHSARIKPDLVPCTLRVLMEPA
jgi:hypothetical protein